MLVKEFGHYILEHPEFADGIPDDALVVMQGKSWCVLCQLWE